MSRTTAHAIRAHAVQSALFHAGRDLAEGVNPTGLYSAHFWVPTPARLDEVIALRRELAALEAQPFSGDSLGRQSQIRARLADIDHELVWEDRFHNLVVTEGRNAILHHFLKGSAYTAAQVLGLIEDTGYSAVAAGNTAANITAAGGGSPANGWNEAPVGTVAARQTPSFGTASGGSLAATATSHSTLATDTIKGAFLLCRSTGGTAPTTTVGNTSGALYSAGVFSGGDQAVSNGGTLQVTYTASA